MIKLENVLTGEKQKKIAVWAKENKINPDFADMLYESLKEPMDFIFLMGKMEKVFEKMKDEEKHEIRDALLRIQVWCSINAHHDPIKAEKQLYISQVMEKLFFEGNLLLEDGSSIDDEKDDGE